MPHIVRLTRVPPGYNLDALPKSTGYRINHSIREAALSCFEPGHNEFWNILTEIAPLLFFTFIAGELSLRDYCGEASECEARTLRQAAIATLLATTLQHAASLFAHVFSCCSARASRVVWYVDYAGILLNFVWNAPLMTMLVSPSTMAWWPTWQAINWLATAALLSASLLPLLGCIKREGDNFISACAASPASMLVTALCIVPNYLLTLAVGLTVDWVACVVVLGLPLSLVVKNLNLPESCVPEGAWRDYFDCSVLHSHSLWHCCVWGLQLCYLHVITGALDASCLPMLAPAAPSYGMFK